MLQVVVIAKLSLSFSFSWDGEALISPYQSKDIIIFYPDYKPTEIGRNSQDNSMQLQLSIY